MHLVHVAAKKFILLLNPLNKSLWSNHTCLLLLWIDLGTLPQHNIGIPKNSGADWAKASERTSTQKSNICTTASQTHKSMCKQSLSTEPGIKITLASHSSCNQGYKLSIQINIHSLKQCARLEQHPFCRSWVFVPFTCKEVRIATSYLEPMFASGDISLTQLLKLYPQARKRKKTQRECLPLLYCIKMGPKEQNLTCVNSSDKQVRRFSSVSPIILLFWPQYSSNWSLNGTQK